MHHFLPIVQPKETQLSVLSIVSNVKDEIEKMEKEEQDQLEQSNIYQQWSVNNGESNNETSVFESEEPEE